MSSCSGDNNNSSEADLFPESVVRSNSLEKPNTTETSISQLSYQDEVLKARKTSSKPFVTPTITSLDLLSTRDNGVLESNSQGLDTKTHLASENFENLTENAASVNTENSQIREVRKPCLFHLKHGFCRYGRNCKYEHGNSSRSAITKQRTDVIDRSRCLPPKNQREGNDENAFGNKVEQICYFFSKKRQCRYGDSCRFIHQEGPFISEELSVDDNCTTPETALKETTDISTKNELSFNNSESFKRSDFNDKDQRKICRLYTRMGNCRFGTGCKYLHVKKNIPSESCAVFEKEPEISGISNQVDLDPDKKNIDRSICKRPGPLRNKKASEMTAEEFSKLRQTEIKQLKKRFPKCTTAASENCLVFEFEFFMSDPDWRFDVKSLNLCVIIPEMYPHDALEIKVMNPDQILPEKLMRYLNKTISAWIKVQHEKDFAKDIVELVFRPFIIWLDQSLEDLFISGLKMVKRDMEAHAAGIQFVTHEELNQAKNTSTIEKDTIPNKQEEQIPAPYEISEIEAEEPMPIFMDNVSSQGVLVDQNVDERAMQETPRRGTEIKLRNLELVEGAATITCRKLTVTIQCGRCKMRNDIAAAPHRNYRIACERCHHQQKLNFRPQMLHAFSAVAGYLDLDSCQVVDVPFLTCEFALQCLPCGRQNLLTSVQYGQRHTSWCLFCNTKMVIFVESVKLNQLQPNVEAVSTLGPLLKIEKKEKRVKDPAVQEGKPLPENGTCKHYKKSFRWLRFPCCGKAYPCDHCHDEKETDHDMKFATRMICGFCAKEQPYGNDRPCVLCSSSMTKKSSAHWEGGKGCRDKIKMSRDDNQKYAGCNKTVSKKVQVAK